MQSLWLLGSPILSAQLLTVSVMLAKAASPLGPDSREQVISALKEVSDMYQKFSLTPSANLTTASILFEMARAKFNVGEYTDAARLYSTSLKVIRRPGLHNVTCVIRPSGQSIELEPFVQDIPLPGEESYNFWGYRYYLKLGDGRVQMAWSLALPRAVKIHKSKFVKA